MTRPLSRYSHRGLLVEIDDASREAIACARETLVAAVDMEALARDLAHLDSLVPHDDDGDRDDV